MLLSTGYLAVYFFKRGERSRFVLRSPLFIFIVAIFRAMISVGTSIAVLALGLVLGVALNLNTSPYHLELGTSQMVLITTSMSAVYYLAWKISRWDFTLDAGKDEEDQGLGSQDEHRQKPAPSFADARIH